MPSMHRSRTIKYRLTMNCKYVRKMPTTSTRKRKKGRLVEPDLLNNGCTAQWTFGEAGLAVPASTDVTTGEKDDVALQTQKVREIEKVLSTIRTVSCKKNLGFFKW